MPPAHLPQQSLKDRIIERIKHEGSLSIADYMRLALTDSTQGYYHIQDPFGQSGDFTTAPEISQVFGELIGVWILTIWDMMARPNPVNLIEMGPGRGTLMHDILRTSKLFTDFLPNTSVHLIETSPSLRQKQRQTLKSHDIEPQWYDRLEDLQVTAETGVHFLVANEFIDALPVNHFIKQKQDWHKRLIGVSAENQLCYTVSEQACSLPDGLPRTPSLYQDGDIFEYRPGHQSFIEQLAKLAKSAPVMALIIDYGHTKSHPGETFQAMKSHLYTHPLAEPGQADLTAHVDFEDLKITAKDQGFVVHNIITQGQFLMALGLAERTTALLQTAAKDDLQSITTGAQRLIDPTQMGHLFKVMVIASPNCPIPPPFSNLDQK